MKSCHLPRRGWTWRSRCDVAAARQRSHVSVQPEKINTKGRHRAHRHRQRLGGHQRQGAGVGTRAKGGKGSELGVVNKIRTISVPAVVHSFIPHSALKAVPCEDTAPRWALPPAPVTPSAGQVLVSWEHLSWALGFVGRDLCCPLTNSCEGCFCRLWICLWEEARPPPPLS